MPDKKNTFDIEAGKRLRHAREALKVAQKDFAGAIGVSPQTLNNWETGDNGAQLYKLAGIWNAFGISLDYVYLNLVQHCNSTTRDKILELKLVHQRGPEKRAKRGAA